MLKEKIFVLITIPILICCCNKGAHSPVSGPSYFDSVIARADRIYDSGYKKKAFDYVNTEHTRVKNLTINDDMIFYSYCGEYFRRENKDYDAYMVYADSMIDELDKYDQISLLPNRYIQAYNMKADALFAKGLYTEAYDYYYKAKKLAQETADSCSMSQYSYSLAMVLYKQQRFITAAGHFLESYNESRTCPDKFIFFYHRQELLDNIGLCYYNAHMYDSAMQFYRMALIYIDTNFKRFDKSRDAYVSAAAVVYGNMADIYMAEHNYDTAQELLQKSININLQKGYTNTDALIDQVKLATLYYEKSNLAALQSTLRDIKTELDTIADNDGRVARSWNKMMWQYYDALHDSANAYKYLLAYVTMNDSFTAHNKLMMATDADSRIKGIERQNSILLLEKNNEQEKISLAIAAVIVLMALIIITLVMRNAKRTRKNLAIMTNLNNQVNEQKEKLQAALTQLELKDKDRSRILRSVAHDVMNPIAAIMAFIDILLTSGDEYNDEQKEIFGLIKEACNNSLSLSKDILEASADHSRLQKEWVNLNKLVADSADLLNFKAMAKKQRIIVTANEPEIKAFVSKEKIWRVVNNLIGNAIKFSHEQADIFVHITTADGKADISVKDSGIGIPEKYKPRIFDMFTEAKASGTSGEVPHGLGLSISMQIAKAHGGSIWFESEEGRGSEFHLVLPLNA